MEQPQQQQHLLHFSDSKHPLVFYPDSRYGGTCCGCQESVYGPSYYCREGGLQHWIDTTHHKSCAELPLGLHHPLHPIHPLILFDEKTHYPEEEHKQKTKCQLCNESRRQYTYRCYRCDFNLHATCASFITNNKMEQPQPQQQLLHFCYSKHPLVFYPDAGGEFTCCGCQESVYGPIYFCREWGCPGYYHHKSCAELPLGLHHPLHPIHPLILFDEKTHYPEEEDKQKTKCQVCNKSRRQYTYRCYRCDFNLHATCASLPPTIQSSQVHHHPLTPFWKWMSFTCDLCAKEVKGIPNHCAPCGFWVHNSCASLPNRLKVIRHKHLLHLTHSYLEVGLHQSDSRFCQLCVQKVNTNYGFYYCSRCDFVAHLDCAADYRYRENMNLQELKELENEDKELDQSVDSAAYEVKNIKAREDGTKIATEIQHFSHEHGLKLSDDEVLNIEKCDGCVQAIFPPFYSCLNCSFFLHESCAKLPRKKRHPLHQHSLTLFLKSPYLSKTFKCDACKRYCNGFIYDCNTCWFRLDVSCSLISDTLTHHGHEHRLLLSSIESKQNCSCCDSKISPIFRCTTCEFALDFKCATLPQTARYKQHEHPFTLCYTAEDDSGEYYCDICEDERDPKHWFYYCANCSYPAHTKCILGKDPNLK